MKQIFLIIIIITPKICTGTVISDNAKRNSTENNMRNINDMKKMTMIVRY